MSSSFTRMALHLLYFNFARLETEGPDGRINWDRMTDAESISQTAIS